MRRSIHSFVAFALLLACSEAPPAQRGSAGGTKSPAAPVVTQPAPVASASAAPAQPAPPSVSVARAERVTFPDGVPSSVTCSRGDDKAYVRCLVEARFAGHPAEQKDALALFDEIGDVVGVEIEQEMDGGFRGTIRLVPELPVGQHKRHLSWILAGQRDIVAFFTAIEAKATKPIRYRHRALAWRFLRSVGRTTPSAYAASWEVGYNVSGSLHSSGEAVRDTVFHEVFHLNDQEHKDWSRRVIGPVVDGIAHRCKSKTPCLTPYAPFKTMVRGGTYYAFQPNNGDIAHEYSAELATRYFREQLAASRSEKYPGGWFKCGPAENAQTMKALADEFFGGVDLTPSC